MSEYGNGRKPDGPQWSGVAAVGRDYWSAELVIPLKAAGAPLGEGEALAFNLFRRNKVNGEWSTWSYVEGFHDQLEPGEFGWLSLPGKVAP